LNVKRSSMAPYRANILSVIRDNYPKFFPITRAGAAVLQLLMLNCRLTDI
jgi:hypothetical protein